MDNREEDRRKRPEGRSKFSRPAGMRDNRRPGSPERMGEGRGPRPERGDRGFARPRAPRNRELAAVQEADEELLRLVMRRARLLAKLRVGDRLDPDMEKALRISWEEKAARLTRDVRLARELFLVVQAVEPLSRAEEDQAFFNLAPVRKTVDINLPAPADATVARCWMALAAASGRTIRLDRVPLTDAVVDAVKVFNQMGGQLWWEENGAILSRGGSGLTRGMDKVLYVGDDAFNLWLLIAFSLNMPARLKITGGSRLRFLDLTPLRRFLPGLGARLTNVVPGQNGLPIRLECAGMLPDTVALPADLPPDFVSALLLAAPFRERPVRFVLPEAAPAAGTPLSDSVLTMLSEAGLKVERNGRSITMAPGLPALPEKPALPMNTLLSAALLALPALAGGRTRLEGLWPSTRSAAAAELLLHGAGLRVRADASGISSSLPENAAPKALAAEELSKICADAPELLPLAVPLAARAALNGQAVNLAAVPTTETETVNALLDRLGLLLNERGDLMHQEENEDMPPRPAWLAPDASWAVALALGAFLRPNLRLGNPGVLTDLFPAFWTVYNTLPTPELERKKAEPVDAKPARRRIIAQGVYGELPPEPPSGDDS